MIYAVLSNFDFVAKFTVKNLNKDFTNAVRGGGHRFMKLFHKIPLFFEGWLPLGAIMVQKRSGFWPLEGAGSRKVPRLVQKKSRFCYKSPEFCS